MQIRTILQNTLTEIVKELTNESLHIQLERTADSQFGDFATNAAFVIGKRLRTSPKEAAERMKEKLLEKEIKGVKEVTVAGPGFVNIRLSQESLVKELYRVLDTDEVEKSSQLDGKKIMVEYAHPNTHKEMHIGHMRTLITGEALSRLLESSGAKVFRANYQGDVGPHVAKALYGIQKIMENEGLTMEKIESWSNSEKAHFLGRGYALGSQEYEENKDTIDNINMQLYTNSSEIADLYQKTRTWSLDYYEELYSRFSTKFDQLFFESDMAEPGIKIVSENVGKVFEKSQGAVIFPGEKYGLHTRVFLTQKGLPLYEAKDIANAYKQYEAFPFERNIHVVANEQAGYFQVVFKALELIDPEKFKDKQYHLSMGMVNLIGRKMSSRTGDVLTVDWLLDQVKEKVEKLVSEGRIESDKKAELIEQIIVGAVKYSVLKVGATQDVAFDIERSVSLEGDSGPYIQYSFARSQSVLRKASSDSGQARMTSFWGGGKTTPESLSVKLENEELQLLRLISQFDEVVSEAAERYAPNMIATYLYDLASAFNLFYQKHPILKAEGEIRDFRLALTQGVGKKLKQGLSLLGIQAPEKM